MVDKDRKLVATLVSIIILLSVVSIISIVYNFLGGFYRSRIVKYDKILGETQTIEVDGKGVYCTACNFSGIVLLDVDIVQDVFIKTSNLPNKLNLRAKAVLVGNTGRQCEIFGYTNWVMDDNDDYIYFNQKIDSNQQIGLCKYVRLNQNLRLESNRDYILMFVVEAYE